MNDIEQQLWDRLKREAENETRREVRISQIAVDEFPLHKKRATDIVKSWDNRGLVTARQNGARAKLTEDGVNTEEI